MERHKGVPVIHDATVAYRDGSRLKTAPGLLPPSLKHNVPNWAHLRYESNPENTSTMIIMADVDDFRYFSYYCSTIFLDGTTLY